MIIRHPTVIPAAPSRSLALTASLGAGLPSHREPRPDGVPDGGVLALPAASASAMADGRVVRLHLHTSPNPSTPSGGDVLALSFRAAAKLAHGWTRSRVVQIRGRNK